MFPELVKHHGITCAVPVCIVRMRSPDRKRKMNKFIDILLQIQLVFIMRKGNQIRITVISLTAIPYKQPVAGADRVIEHTQAPVVIMSIAKWNGVVLADSDRTITIEGNLYFPPDSVKEEYLRETTTHSTCPWKGVATYYDVIVEGKINKEAAWLYSEPKLAAKEITNYVAFWKGVEVKE